MFISFLKTLPYNIFAAFCIAPLEGHVYFSGEKFLCSAQSACASSFSRTMQNYAQKHGIKMFSSEPLRRLSSRVRAKNSAEFYCVVSQRIFFMKCFLFCLNLFTSYNTNMKIYIGSDHAGYELKEKLKAYIQSLRIEVVDKGAFMLDNEDDYPDFIVPVAEAVVKDTDSFGIILGGSGEGEQISANKIDGVRAIEYYGGNLEIVKLGREHNNANILSLGARFISENEAKNAIILFMNTPFSDDARHTRRINKIDKEEK